MSEFDLPTLLESLAASEVEFVVIGGVAVAAHGFIRGTEDLDIVPNPERTNLERLSLALAKARATLPTAEGRLYNVATDQAILAQGGNLTTDTPGGGLDIVQQGPGLPSYEELAESAIDAEVQGTRLRICSLAQLRAMKAANGRPQDRLDLDNLPED